MSRQPAAKLALSRADAQVLRTLVSDGTTPQRTARRARAMLLAASGAPNTEIAKKVNFSRQALIALRQRFLERGMDAVLKNAPRGKSLPRLPQATELKILSKTLETKPRSATHWSTRSMAAVVGVSNTTVCRVWQAHGLKPHRVRTFKLSTDPDFAPKLKDIVGLYLNPPDKAMVLSVDEKSQIQALDRTQPALPMGPGHPEGYTHDYVRHGTATLFAALNTATGKVIAAVKKRHRHVEFLAFLKQINQETPRAANLHLILDNYGTHKHPRVREWLRAHPRFHLHFTPTSSSWLNLVEAWFSVLTRQRIRRGTFRSVNALKTALESFVAENNNAPTPFVWTKKASEILRKIRKCQPLLATQH